MRPSDARRGRFPRGIPAASLKDLAAPHTERALTGFPRGIPAASLKAVQLDIVPHCDPGFPRGIPAASLKGVVAVHELQEASEFSAGNTRGLIEGWMRLSSGRRTGRFPRGIPAASLKVRPASGLTD